MKDISRLSLPADLCLWRVLHSQTFVFERGEEILPDIHTAELCSVQDVRYSNSLEIILFLHSGSITQEYAREHLITVNAVPSSPDIRSQLPSSLLPVSVPLGELPFKPRHLSLLRSDHLEVPGHLLSPLLPLLGAPHGTVDIVQVEPDKVCERCWLRGIPLTSGLERL